jgi:putative flippase GtrA
MKKELIKQFFKFGIVGVLNTLINLFVLYLLTEIVGVYYLVSAVFAFLVAVTNSFILNKVWTFNEKLKYKAHSRYAKFFVISVFALLINLLILYTGVELFGFWYLFAQFIAICSNLIINFFGNKIWTFRN